MPFFSPAAAGRGSPVRRLSIHRSPHPIHRKTRDMTYRAPLEDMLFDMEHLAQIDAIAALPGFEDAGLETARAAPARLVQA